MKLWYCEDESGALVIRSNRKPKTALAEAPHADVRVLDKTTDENGEITLSINYDKMTQIAQDDLDAANAQALVEMRNTRTALLFDCDWTLMEDSPLSPEDKELWRAYRKELRDLPENVEDPNNITWPTKPGEENE